MASLDMTAYDAALRELYPDGVESLMFDPDDNPFFVWLEKSPHFVGDLEKISVRHSNIRGSNTFANALTAKSAPTFKAFQLTRAKTYTIGSVENEVTLASEDGGAAASALDQQIDAAMDEQRQATAIQLWGDWGGSRGRSTAAMNVATQTIPLLDARDAVKFEVGMQLQFSATNGTAGAVRAGLVTVAGIDRDAGTMTVAEASIAAGIPLAAASDWLFRAGDFGSSIRGMADWVPATAPAPGDNHFGVDRSADVVRLAGTRYSTGGPIESMLIRGIVQLRNNGGRKPDGIWLNPIRHAELVDALVSKTWIDVKTSKPDISFRAIAINTDLGLVPVLADRYCPYRYGFAANRKSLVIKHLGPLPHFDETDGKKFVREATSDGYEFRIKQYWQLRCDRPVDLLRWDFGA